jgi:peptide-N4-(N-acetyl-beta-glucosaminyl)asparagine amidase
MRRDNLSKEDRRRLVREDDREERELRGYYAATLAQEISGLIPGSTYGSPTSRQEDNKLPGRQSGQEEWVRNRGEGGTGRPGPDNNRRGGQS